MTDKKMGPNEAIILMEQAEAVSHNIAGLVASYYQSLCNQKNPHLPEKLVHELVLSYHNALMGNIAGR